MAASLSILLIAIFGVDSLISPETLPWTCLSAPRFGSFFRTEKTGWCFLGFGMRDRGFVFTQDEMKIYKPYIFIKSLESTAGYIHGGCFFWFWVPNSLGWFRFQQIHQYTTWYFSNDHFAWSEKKPRKPYGTLCLTWGWQLTFENVWRLT